jgi:hypothetical protein
MKSIPVLATVALNADISDRNLTRGQIGTVVEYLERPGKQALLVEFSDEQGQTYAMVELSPDQVNRPASQDRGGVRLERIPVARLLHARTEH